MNTSEMWTWDKCERISLDKGTVLNAFWKFMGCVKYVVMVKMCRCSLLVKPQDFCLPRKRTIIATFVLKLRIRYYIRNLLNI